MKSLCIVFLIALGAVFYPLETSQFRSVSAAEASNVYGATTGDCAESGSSVSICGAINCLGTFQKKNTGNANGGDGDKKEGPLSCACNGDGSIQVVTGDDCDN